MLRDTLRHGLIVSCQPVPDGPTDTAEFVIGFARAAVAAGASALRIESVAYLKAVRPFVTVPIVGIVKRDLDDSPVRITPFIEDVQALADAGADIIAFDATDRPRPASVTALVQAAKARGKLTMADCSSIEDAECAVALGIDFVGTTLSGYVGGPEPVEPDLALIAAMRKLTEYVIAEGRIRTTEQAAQAAEAGAYAVVVGSAITRTEHVTSWFHDAISAVYRRSAEDRAVLSIDIGGTKTLAALVKGDQVLDEIRVPTTRKAGPDGWLSTVADVVEKWSGRYDRVGIAVTGFVDDGRWSALNTATLEIPDGYPLVEKAAVTFGKPVLAVNDAQAAAWGEYRFGAGVGGDMVFLTISTGLGGGIVINGRLLGGVSGHFGIIRGPSAGAAPFEDQVSGRWIAQQAMEAGHGMDAPAVFDRARNGEEWARSIVDRSAQRVALLCSDIQFMLDPGRIVIGGGIGLAEGYLDMVGAYLPEIGMRLKPTLVPARLGAAAGIVGAADLARLNLSARTA